MKKTVIALVAAATFAPALSVAQDKKAKKASYQTPNYGMAGCGLGSTVFGKNNSMGPQLSAATTNNTFFPGSYPITTGTSNCSDGVEGSAGTFRMESETFISVNLGTLNKEAAQGEGDHLRSLAEIVGCGADEQFTTFASVTQTGHTEIFSDAVPANVATRLIDKVKQDETLQNCVRGQ
ncbi:MAG: DUF3015 domain-containing protein [Proteobacteria bacterium]|nr:DUF3015 domain-containing protein [Pseudomonadota bacterium]